MDIKPNTIETGAIKPESNKLGNVDGAKTPYDATEITEIVKKQSEEPQENKTEETVKTTKKHIIKYVGGGIWVDNNGISWAKDHPNKNIITSCQFDDDEYNIREDIKFMVRYGAMEHEVVEM